MKKRVMILMMSFIMVFGSIKSISASEAVPMGDEMMTDEAIEALLKDPDGLSPYWMYILSSFENMSIDSDGLAALYGALSGDTSFVNKVTCYMYLQKQSPANGGFVNMASWRTTVPFYELNMEKSYRITSTGTYRLYCIYHAYYGTGPNDYEITSGYSDEVYYQS